MRWWIVATMIMLCGCSGSSDDDGGVVYDHAGGTQAPQQGGGGTPEVLTLTPDPFPDQLGVYQARNTSCVLVGDSLVASGEVTTSETTSDVLCAWGGTEAFPLYGYACSSNSAPPGVWSPFSIDTGYGPASYGEDPEDIECVLCTANASSPYVCY